MQESDVAAYERAKLETDQAVQDQYRLPTWYRSTFLWLWPFVVIGVLAFFVLDLQRTGSFAVALVWFIGLLVFAGFFSWFFQRLS